MYGNSKREARIEIKAAKLGYEKRLSENIKSNSKAFWNCVQSKCKTTESVGNLVDEGGVIVSEGTKKATILNEFFTSVFTKENTSKMPTFNNRNNRATINSFKITTEVVGKYLKELNASKSQGPDNLHPKLSLETLEEIKNPLTEIFNKSLQEGTVPNDWKLANIIPLHKKGSKSSPKKYRPISLTLVAFKLMEKLVRDKTMSHMEEKNLFTKHQHGFRKGYSCVTQLIDVCEKWTEELDNKNSVDVVYLDFQKAFDSVPHKRLLSKLKGCGIQGKLLKWIENFLKNRKQRVQVNGSSSEWVDVTSGIPQGSVLGPLLFLIYINDLPDVVHSFIKLFVDNAKLYAVVKTARDATVVQNDLGSLDNWSEIWQINFNNDKCTHMHLGKDQEFSMYSMRQNGAPVIINQVTEQKDLGVTINNKLEFVPHIQAMVKKANRN